jgi:hypothetical protein
MSNNQIKQTNGTAPRFPALCSLSPQAMRQIGGGGSRDGGLGDARTYSPSAGDGKTVPTEEFTFGFGEVEWPY